VEIRIQKREIIIYLRIDSDNITLNDGFTRDVRNVGHYGTGDLEVIIKNLDDFERAKNLTSKSYENS
jgi:predicted transport protein